MLRRPRGAPRALAASSTDGSEDGGFEGSSDSSQWETDYSDNEAAAPAPKKKPEPAAGAASDSNDEHAEKCPICLLSFKQQEIGTPETCDHSFCVDCIQKWSRNVNTCPVDRQTYSLILVRKELNGRVVRQIPVEAPVQQEEDDGGIDGISCEICGGRDREDRMLLCDGCNLGFHMECLNPPLERPPYGNWFCRACLNDGAFDEIDTLDEIGFLLGIDEGWPR